MIRSKRLISVITLAVVAVACGLCLAFGFNGKSAKADSDGKSYEGTNHVVIYNKDLPSADATTVTFEFTNSDKTTAFSGASWKGVEFSATKDVTKWRNEATDYMINLTGVGESYFKINGTGEDHVSSDIFKKGFTGAKTVAITFNINATCSDTVQSNFSDVLSVYIGNDEAVYTSYKNWSLADGRGTSNNQSHFGFGMTDIGAETLRFDDVKCYDDKGNTLETGVFGGSEIPPEVNDTSSVEEVDISSTSLGVLAYMSAEKVNTDWFFMEWTNGENTITPLSKSGGERVAFILADNRSSMTGPDQHPVGISITDNIYDNSVYQNLLESGASIKIAFNMKDGGVPYALKKSSGSPDYVPFTLSFYNGSFSKSAGGLNDGTCYVGIWLNGIIQGKVVDAGDESGTGYQTELLERVAGETGNTYTYYTNKVAGTTAKLDLNALDTLRYYFDGANVYRYIYESDAEGLNIKDFKCYGVNDKKFNDVVDFGTKFYGMGREVPVVADLSKTIPVSATSSATGSVGFMSSKKIESDWVFFEWDNGTNFPRNSNGSGGENFSFIGAYEQRGIISPDQTISVKKVRSYIHAMESFKPIFTSNAHIKIVFNMKDGGSPIVYVDDVKQALSFTANEWGSSEGGLNNGQYYVGIWFNGMISRNDGFNTNNLICYDENGNNLGIAFSNMKHVSKVVRYMNGSAEFKLCDKAIPGSAYSQFTNLGTPTKAGEYFVGWTKTNGGVDFVSDSDFVPENGITLYARFSSAKESNFSSYKGVFKNDKRYFELTADGKCVSYFSMIPAVDYAVYDVGGTKVYKIGGELGTRNGNVLTLSGVDYQLSEDYKTVKYMAEGKVYKEVKVPTGMTAIDSFEYLKTAHSFSGWKLNGVVYNFAKPVTANLTLEADLKINQMPPSSYLEYNFVYYNAKTNTMYGLNDNGTYDKYVNGVGTTGDYVLASDGEEVYVFFDGNYDDPYYIDSSYLRSGTTNYTRTLGRGYTVKVVLGNGEEDLTLTADATNGYKITLPAEPTLEGSTFKGYKLGDGSDFDANGNIFHNMTIYAVWENADASTTSGCGSDALSTYVAVAITLCACAVVVLLRKREN